MCLQMQTPTSFTKKKSELIPSLEYHIIKLHMPCKLLFRYIIVSSELRGQASIMTEIFPFNCLLTTTTVMNSFFLAFTAYLEVIIWSKAARRLYLLGIPWNRIPLRRSRSWMDYFDVGCCSKVVATHSFCSLTPRS